MEFCPGVVPPVSNLQWLHVRELGNTPIPDEGKESQPPSDTAVIGKVGCDEWRGGVVKHYYREAA